MSERNPDLPILDELGAEFEELARAASGEQPRGARKRLPLRPPRDGGDSGGRRAQARRIGRRAAIVVVLICLVGGGAVAALRGHGSGDANTKPALLGRGADGAWRFSAYRHEGESCVLFEPRGGELSSNCAASPGRGQVFSMSSLAGGRRYVFGVVGPGVARISAALGTAGAGARPGPRSEFGVRVPVDSADAGDAGFPDGDGWFVLDLGRSGRGGRDRSPVVIVPLTRRGARAGRPYVDCSLGALAPACRSRIRSAARRQSSR